MTPLQELQAQRDFLMANTWVGRAPKKLGEGCLVMRWEVQQKSVQLADSCLILNRVIGPGWGSLITWNDEVGRTFSEVIDALDAAILLAKQAEADQQ